MSKKSRARTDARRAEKQTADLLELQKKHIQNATAEQIIYTILWGIMTVVFTVVLAITNPSSLFLYVIIALLTSMTVLWTVRVVRRYRVARLYASILHATEETVSFRCRKVTFLEREISRQHSILFCVAFYAEDGRVFYYVYPHRQGLSSAAIGTLRERLPNKDIELICYRGTTAVKEFEP